jgi:hypothetical protein
MTDKGSSAAHTKLVSECCQELALMGYAAWPNRTGATTIDGRFIRFGKKGSGDILVLLPTMLEGRIFAVHGEVECKTGKATQSKRQRTHMNVVHRSGGVYVVAHSSIEMKSKLADLGYCARSTA